MIEKLTLLQPLFELKLTLLFWTGGWLGGWVGGWICLRIKLTSALVLAKVELRMSLAKGFIQHSHLALLMVNNYYLDIIVVVNDFVQIYFIKTFSISKERLIEQISYSLGLF